MEKPFKIIISIVAAVLISMATIGFSDGVSHSIKVDQKNETTGSRLFVAEELPYLDGFSVKEGTSYFSAGNTNPVSLKQQQVQKAVIHALEVQVACAILQNISQLQINPVRIRKSDMLFPFHYFFETDQA